MAIEKILVVDDEMIMRNFLSETLRRKEFDVTIADGGKTAFPLIRDEVYDLVITDMKMPDTTGIEILKKVKEKNPNTQVIVITAYASIENAVEAMKLGAFNYLIKPFSPDTIEAVLDKVQEHQAVLDENKYLRKEVAEGSVRTSHHIIAESAVMKSVLDGVRRVAKSGASVFINGESGTGKEVIAHAIHNFSQRSNRPFIRVNCAAIPDTLIESEFFGHEKGAFTGATGRRQGRFELAHGGTLLLDEVTEIPMALQAKLLRVIQEQELERVGGSKLIKVDVRLVSTSNRNMKEAIEDRLFREDLFYRLNVVPLHLPALRERREDILPLARYFLENMCLENHVKMKTFDSTAEKKLLDYHWPGNIRELANVIERTVVMNYDTVVAKEHLVVEKESSTEQKKHHQLPIGIPLSELEQRMIIETLHAQDNNRTRTAQVLGISIRTLRNKLNEYQKQGLTIH